MNKEKNLIDQRASLRVDTRETQQLCHLITSLSYICKTTQDCRSAHYKQNRDMEYKKMCIEDKMETEKEKACQFVTMLLIAHGPS